MTNIEKQLEWFEKKGFLFLPAWTMDSPITPDRIKFPSGNIFDMAEIYGYLANTSETIKEKDYSQASEYYTLIRELDVKERHETYTFSFMDEKDISDCARKYVNS